MGLVPSMWPARGLIMMTAQSGSRTVLSRALLASGGSRFTTTTTDPGKLPGDYKTPGKGLGKMDDREQAMEEMYIHEREKEIIKKKQQEKDDATAAEERASANKQKARIKFRGRPEDEV